MSELEEKQKYLRENILEKQYDAQQFMDFCQSQVGSVDIGAWSLLQLKNIAQKFIQEQRKKITSEQIGLSNYDSSIKEVKNIQNTIDDWSDFVEATPKKQQNQQFQLNLADLNFLQTLEMKNANQSTQQTSQTTNISKNKLPTNIPIHKQIQQKPSNNFTSNNNKPKGPNQDLLKNLQFNEGFISVFNSTNTNNKNPFEQLQKQQSQNSVLNKQPIQSQKNVSLALTIPNNNGASQSEYSTQNNKNSVPQFTKPSRDFSSPSQSFILDVKCKQIATNKIPENVICKISGHQIVNPNVFVPKFVLYTIASAPLNITVKRKMKDFELLRNLLKKMFPTTQIPHLQRCSRMNQTEPHAIAKQKLYLQSFLNSLLMNSSIRCKILEDFLFCKDEALIKKIFREYEKMEKPKAVEELWTANGKAKLDTNTANRKYMAQQQLYVDYIANNFGKIKALYDQLTVQYQNTSKIVSDIAQIYEQVCSTTKSVNQAFAENLRFQSFLQMIDAVSQMHKQISQSLQTKSKYIQSQLKHMFKYEQENFASIRQTMKVLTNIYQTYEKRSDKESANKDNYQNKKLSQYKSGVEVPSKHITVLKHQSAYAQNQYKQQLCRYMDELAKKIGGVFQIFTTLQISLSGDMDLVWRQFQQFAYKNMNKGIQKK